MDVLLFEDSDLKADGQLRAKNNSKIMSEQEFKLYVLTNRLTASCGYIDLIGNLSNGKKENLLRVFKKIDFINADLLSKRSCFVATKNTDFVLHQATTRNDLAVVKLSVRLTLVLPTFTLNEGVPENESPVSLNV